MRNLWTVLFLPQKHLSVHEEGLLFPAYILSLLHASYLLAIKLPFKLLLEVTGLLAPSV